MGRGPSAYDLADGGRPPVGGAPVPGLVGLRLGKRLKLGTPANGLR